MNRSILAGILISIGGIAYLTCANAIVGAFLFSIGLYTILYFKLNLFTGKAGLVVKEGMTLSKLMKIYGGNAIGCGIGGLVVRYARPDIANSERLAAIITTRSANSMSVNVILGIFCGILMYVAVTSYSTNPMLTMMFVAAFIISGFNHCIADLFYFSAGVTIETIIPMIAAIYSTTLGNMVGCMLIPALLED